MFGPTTKAEAPSVSRKDAAKKMRKKTRAKQSSFVPMCEDEEVVPIAPTTTTEEGMAKKTEPMSTPKQEERNISDMETPEIRTQTRLTLRYDDLLLSQAVDPQCEVSWECISPEVVQRIHKDIQRKPNLDIGKMLSLIADEDEPPSNSTSDINKIFVNTKPYVPSSKKVTMKRKKLSSRNKTTSDMEELIMKLEVQIANEAKEKMVDESMNCKSTADLPETLKQQHLPNTSSKNEECDFSDKVLTECLPAVSESTSCEMRKTTQLPLHQCSDSGTVISDEETTWSDEDLFCDESFIAKMTQASGTKTNSKNGESNPPSRLDDPFTADKKTSPNFCQTSSLGVPYRNRRKETKTESSRNCLQQEVKTTRSSFVIDADMNVIEKKHNDNNNNNNDGMNVELDLAFSDSDTDDLLSQLTEQELCCAIQPPTKEDCLTTQKTAADNNNLSDLVAGVAGEIGTDRNNTDTEKGYLNSYLDFFTISSSGRKPSPGKSQLTASSKKHKVYSFKSTKNNKKSENDISTSCSAPIKLNDIASTHLNNSFDDAFSDKDDDILIFAESLDQTCSQFDESITDVKKESSCDIVTSKRITPKAKKLICSKEEIERKKREALNRRKKLGAVKKK